MNKVRLTKATALKLFNEQCGIFNSATTGKIDKPMRAEAWNNFTDALCKDGFITAAQYHNWSNPF